MALYAVAALILLQTSPAGYRVGQGTATPAATYRTGPAPAPVPAQDDGDEDEEERSAQAAAGYRIAPDALSTAPVLRPTGVTIEAYDAVRAEGFREPEDRAYESLILGGAAAAQDRQGALDGAWELYGEGGRPLYAFQLSQPADSDPIEGAWRRDTGSAGPRASGFLLAAHDPEGVTFRFFEPGGTKPITVVLQPAAGGSWRGTMSREDSSTAVELRRR